MSKAFELEGVQVPVFPPGPKSQATWARRKESVGNANYTGLYGVSLLRGDQALIEDEDGNIYLDCLACASSCVLGYGQEFLVEAYSNQAEQLQQSCFTYSLNLPAIELAEKLISLAPGDFEKRVMIGLSGSDSSGGAVKASRMFTGLDGIIHFKNDYHGSTGISQQASDYGDLNDGIYHKNPDFIEFPFPTTPAEASAALAGIADTLSNKKAGGIICEAIQGDAGVVVPPAGFLADLRQVTQETNTLLILDEIQSGMGRTGEWWAFQHDGVVPDIFVVAKGLSAGYAPISAVVGREDVIDSLGPGQHIFTYGGHPPSAAVATAVLDYIETQNIPTHAAQIGGPLLEQLAAIQSRFSSFMLEVRGKGLMIGVQIDVSTDPCAGKIFATRCMELGLYVGFFGVAADVVRIEPPLTIDAADADFIASTVNEVATQMQDGTIPPETLENVKKYSIGI